ncbi:MAG: acyl-CoA thioesterase [Muribaculaceae bacterium]|nr:acyl-CoA thioesterase [Muribaculaceae bacterium]
MKQAPQAQHPFRCTTPVQLRFSDLDTLGHVNNAVYFSLFDLAKSDYFNKVKGAMQDWTRVNVVLANIHCDFLSQVLFDERVVVKTQTLTLGDKSFTLLLQLENEDTGEVKCVCTQIMVYLDPDTLRPARVSDEWRRDLSRFECRDLESECNSGALKK